MPTEDLLAPSLPAWTAADGPLADLLADRDPSDLALVVGVADGEDPWEARARTELDASGFAPDELVATHEPTTAVGSTTVIRLPQGEHPARVLVLVGLGAGAPEDLRLAGAAAGRATRGRAQVVVRAPPTHQVGAGAVVGGAGAGWGR